MSLKAALYQYLSGVSGLSALVDNRIYPDVAPETAGLPYIVHRIISADHVRHMIAASGFVGRRVQFDVYGTTALSVDNVFDELSAALEAFRGEMGSDDLDILSSGIESERDDFIPPQDGSQVGKHRRSVDFNIWHRL
jgi:hypothetical protein